MNEAGLYIYIYIDNNYIYTCRTSHSVLVWVNRYPYARVQSLSNINMYI